MNRYEKQEIAQLPRKYRPLSAWAYFGYQILFTIPLIGQICLIACALSKTNIVRRSFARSYFCVLILAAIAIGILIGMAGGLAGISKIIEQIKPQ